MRRELEDRRSIRRSFSGCCWWLYLYDIRSDRQLCEDVHHNFAYRWFCRLALDDKVPDHSSLSRIRDRYGEEIFEALSRRIVETCQKRGLVAPQCRVMTDATLIAADAA